MGHMGQGTVNACEGYKMATSKFLPSLVHFVRGFAAWAFSVPRRKQQMNHTTEARGANLPAPRFAITLVFSPFFLETYHNDNSLYVKVLKFYLKWINFKKIRCTIRLWSKRIYLNHTDRAQSTFWRGLVVCLKRMMIYDYSF